MQLQNIYQAKCDDLNIPVLAIQEKRFFEYCTKFLSNRHFNLAESGVGPVAGKVIADAVRNNPAFCKLTLAKNILGDTGAIIVVRTLARALNIIHLDLSSNSISPEGAMDVLKVVTTHGSLVSFDISSQEGLHRNRLGPQGALAVVHLLKRNRLLWILNISGTALGNDGLEAIVDGITDNKTLLSLGLGNNNITGKSIESFSRAVAFSNLTHLNLAANRLGNQGCDFISALIMGSYGTACPLRFLDISRNEIGFPGSSKIFNAMSRNANLESLIINDNPMTGQFNIALCHFVCDNHALKHLDLTNCDLRANGAAAIGEGLTKNHGMKVLLLGSNLIEVRHIQDSEMAAFATGMERNSALVHLDLSNNKISDKGGVLLCNALKRNGVLQRLNLKDNEFHDLAGQVLAEVTRKQSNIVKVTIENNPISYKYANEIRSNLVLNGRVRVRSQAPMILRQLRELEMMDYDVTHIERDMQYQLAEQRKAEDQLEKQKEKFAQMKEQEEQKTLTIVEELQQVKQTKLERGMEYQNLLAEMSVERVSCDEHYKALDDKLSEIAAEVYKTTKERNPHSVQLLKRTYAERRSQSTLQVARLNEDLERERNKKNMQEMTLQALLKQIEGTKAEIEQMTKPKAEEAKAKEAAIVGKKGAKKNSGRKVRKKASKSPKRKAA